MKIVTNTDLYVGRYFHENSPEPDFVALIPYGMTDPFKIPKGTEIRTIEHEEFNSLEDLYNELEEGMFRFIFHNPAQETLFETLIDYGNNVNYNKDSFSYE